MGYASITAGIKTVLTSVTALQEIYAEEPNVLLEYPCATINAVAHNDTFADTSRNQRAFTFVVRLYQRTNDVTHGESVLLGIADSVLAALEAAPTLNSSCTWSRPTRGNWLYVERETPVRVCEITVEAFLQVAR